MEKIEVDMPHGELLMRYELMRQSQELVAKAVLVLMPWLHHADRMGYLNNKQRAALKFLHEGIRASGVAKNDDNEIKA